MLIYRIPILFIRIPRSKICPIYEVKIFSRLNLYQKYYDERNGRERMAEKDSTKFHEIKDENHSMK